MEWNSEDVATAIDAMVVELLDAARIYEPPVDAWELADSKIGIAVSVNPGQRQRGRYQRRGREQIMLRPEQRGERIHWATAHEIGESLKNDILQRLGISSSEVHSTIGEQLANQFANRLLVPSCWFWDDARKQGHDLLNLKKRYTTASHEVIARRLLELPEPCVITIIDNCELRRRESNTWSVDRTMRPIEEQCFEYVHHFSRKWIAHEAGTVVQGWPVHEPDWKREILRTVLDQ